MFLQKLKGSNNKEKKPLQQTKLPELSKLPATRHYNVALDNFTTAWIHLHKTSPNDGQLSDLQVSCACNDVVGQLGPHDLYLSDL